jgi:hypothetical protein
MPLSPFTRLLIALTLLAFPWFFMWLEDSYSRVSSTMLGVSLTLLVATVFMVVRDNPVFDDRAFLRSRPGGDSKAFRRSTRTLLGIVAVVSLMAACLPLLDGRSGRRPREAEALPVSSTTLTRHPAVEAGTEGPEDPRHPRLQRKMDGILPFEDRLSVDGLKEDEFVALDRLGPDRLSPQVTLGYSTRGGGSFGGQIGILRQPDSTPMTCRRSLLEHLASRIPGHPELILSEGEEATGNWVSFPRFSHEKQEVDYRAKLESLTWSIDGRVFRIEDAGSFPLATGGWHRLPAGGTIRVWPVEQNLHGSWIRVRIVISAFDDLVNYRGLGDETAGLPMALIVDESGRRAWLPSVAGGSMHPLDSRNYRLASRWLDWRISFGERNQLNLPPFDVSSARLYLFMSRPGARIQATLPPER